MQDIQNKERKTFKHIMKKCVEVKESNVEKMLKKSRGIDSKK